MKKSKNIVIFLKRETNSSLSLEKQVARIYSLRKEIENSYLIYRYINGLNLHKEERYIDKSELAKLNDGSLKLI